MLLLQLLCLIQVRQPEFPIRDKEILQKNCITVGIVYCLHYIFVPLLSCGVLLFLEGFSCEKENWCSCQGTTEAGKIVLTFIIIQHFGMLPFPFAFALLLPLLAFFLLLRLSSRLFPCSRQSSSDQQGH